MFYLLKNRYGTFIYSYHFHKSTVSNTLLGPLLGKTKRKIRNENYFSKEDKWSCMVMKSNRPSLLTVQIARKDAVLITVSRFW